MLLYPLSATLSAPLSAPLSHRLHAPLCARLRAISLALTLAGAALACDDAREVNPVYGGEVGGGTGPVGAAGAAGGVSPADPFGPEGPLGPRAPVQTCALPDPPVPSPVALEALSGLRVPSPVGAIASRAPGAELIAAERGGRLWAWRAGEQQRLIGTIAVSEGHPEQGLLAVAISPSAPSPSAPSPSAEERPLFTLYSSTRCARSGGPLCVLLSRWRLMTPLALDAGSEQVLLEVPLDGPGRLGGGLAFDNDGALYVALGDGGDAPNGGGVGDLRGAVLHLDVSAPDPECGTPYSVPANNPNAANRCGVGEGRRPELWAWGLRQPRRLSFDAPTGSLFVSDEGARQEEVSRVVGAGDHGWPVVDGDACAQEGCARGRYVAPFVTLARSEEPSLANAAQLTGGFVYRGATHPTFAGYYLHADRAARRLVATPPNAPRRAQVLVEDVDIAAISEGADLEPIVWSAEGEASRLISLGDPLGAAPFPQLLSLTGCFSDLPSATTVSSVVPYDVNRPFWSDRADKERAFALPTGTQITYAPAGEPLSFPEGTVAIKTFYLTSRAGLRRRYETRLLHYSSLGWVGYTYRWREDLSDADLLLNGYDENLEGPIGVQRWSFLDPGACGECHTGPSGRTLGLSVEQLNLTRDYGGVLLNQLEALERAGYLRLPAPPETLPRLSRLADPALSVERDARELLHVNCAYCHLPGHLPHLSLDLRLNTPFSEMGICDVAPTLGDIVVPDARLVAPGDPNRSVLLLRAQKRGSGQMPPLATHMEDFEGAATLALWISQLTGCDP